MSLYDLLKGAGLGGYGASMRMCGCGVDDDPGRPIFCRVGSKYRLRDKIVPLIPAHKTYVEPFAGSSAIFFAKPKAERNVLNDLDAGVVKGLHLIQKAPTDMESYPDVKGRDSHRRLWNSTATTTGQKIAKRITETCSGFMSMPIKKTKNIFKGPSIRAKVRHIGEFKEKLQGVKILSKDYAKVISQYDSPSTFFFLDPPYEDTDKSFGYAEDKGFDFDRLRDTLKRIKGNFLMTINDSPKIRELYSGFQQRPFIADTGIHQSPGSGKREKYVRKELYISNYKLP